MSFVGGKRSQLGAKKPFSRCFVGSCDRFADKKVAAASNKVVVGFFLIYLLSFHASEHGEESLQGEIVQLIDDMKKTYHLCLSAGNEIMFRDLEDYNRGFNSFALALYKTGSTGLVESFMSNHLHLLVQTADPAGFMYAFRQSYSMYFNHKYRRGGRLAEKRHFTLETVGYHHMVAAASYVLRNPLHHGVAPTPYAYRHNSANAIFRLEMGKFYSERLIPSRSYHNYIGKRAVFPEQYKMTESGVFTRESVLDVPQVENLFGTPRAFNFYMSRKSSEEWEVEQRKDDNGLPPVSLDVIEQGVCLHPVEKMIVFESGKADYQKISDMDLCVELDNLARMRYGKHSVYQLSLKEKQEIAEKVYRAYRISGSRICRCLALVDGH